jgi:signal transduction histidine kinase/ActR/RegA family two-component response regulator
LGRRALSDSIFLMTSSLRNVLSERQDDIVARFVAEVRRKDISPPAVSGPLVVDHIPLLLDEIVAALANHPTVRVSQDAIDVSATARQHGGQRWGLGYDLEAVVREYGMLRHVILEFARAAGASPSIDEFDVLAKCLNVGVAEAVSEYTRYRDHQLEAERAHLEFLSRAGELLSSSLDYPSTLTRLARLIVPQLADWCAVHVEGLDVEKMPIAHVSSDKIATLRDIFRRFPLVEQSLYGYPAVLQNGKPLVVDSISEGLLEASARSSEHLAALRKIGAKSWITVPLRIQSTILGGITLAASESGRRYGSSDLILAEELARRAAAAIDNARLYELSKIERSRMEAATRAKDEFVAVVSHELRTPLNVIVGWIRLLKSSALSEEKREHSLEVIERNANALSQLVADLLDISRVISGKIRINPSQVDLANVVDIALEDARLALETKRLRVHVDLDREKAVMRGDADRLQQIVWNLLTNALKFTPKGGEIWITLRRVDSDLELEVRDNGIGIEPEFLPHVFESFRHGNSSTTRTHRGLGIGLSITKHLVDLHGGSIALKSGGIGRGTSATVRLPVSPLVSTTVGVVRVAATMKRRYLTIPEGLEGLRVLVVDDEPDARDLFRVLLESCGIEVRDAASVRDAMAQLENYRPDVMISDIGMPEEDGYALITRIRALPAKDRANLPAIALTAFASNNERTQALLAGFNVHMGKPVEPAQLLETIADLAGRTIQEPKPASS